MTAKVFEVALGITTPWSVTAVQFDDSAKVLTVLVDFKPGSRFVVSGHEGLHPVHDTVVKTYRHLNFFQHACCSTFDGRVSNNVCHRATRDDRVVAAHWRSCPTSEAQTVLE